MDKNKKCTTTECQIFDWQSWDEMGGGAMVFYGCTIVNPFGKYNKGDFVDSIAIDHEKSLIECYDEDGLAVYTGKLVLTVEEH